MATRLNWGGDAEVLPMLLLSVKRLRRRSGEIDHGEMVKLC